jgi:3-dehydroquinate dehydratase/shikimate dehydrogenase
MPPARVCLTVTGMSLARGLKAVERCRRYIDLVELRADFLSASELSRLSRFPRLAGLPVILTLRRRQDRGGFAGTEAERRGLLAAAGGSFAYVDLEEDLEAPDLEAALRSRGVRIIRSFHDFEKVPADLAERVRRLPRRGDEIPRAAVRPAGCGDLLRLVRSAREVRDIRDKLLIGMGPVGLPTRILSARLGSGICFTAEPGEEPAPGRLDPVTLAELYRFAAIRESTGLFGVIGNPIAHSRSPEIHNRGYARLGLDAVYLPFLVDDPGAFFALARELDIRGFSVTIPHKQAVLPLLTKADEAVRRVGACNTVIRRGRGWQGSNTDVEGFLQPLRGHLPASGAGGLSAAVIGAGGAARAVVFALTGVGIRPLVLNRSPERAAALAREFGCTHAGLDARAPELLRAHSGLIVQTSSVGMEPDDAGDPLPEYVFRGHEIVYDLVYKPPRTRFLARAEAAGCTVIPGYRMLRAQAEAQFRLFTGQSLPPD